MKDERPASTTMSGPHVSVRTEAKSMAETDVVAMQKSVIPRLESTSLGQSGHGFQPERLNVT